MNTTANTTDIDQLVANFPGLVHSVDEIEGGLRLHFTIGNTVDILETDSDEDRGYAWAEVCTTLDGQCIEEDEEEIVKELLRSSLQLVRHAWIDHPELHSTNIGLELKFALT